MEEETKMGYRYFHLISEDIQSITRLLVPASDELMKDAIKLIAMDVGFMRLFYLCLSQWDFTEQSRESLTSMITALEDIWGIHKNNARYILNNLRYILSRLKDQHFHTVNFEMESEIQHSKLQIQEWCGNLLLLSMQCKSLTYPEARQFLRLVNESLEEFVNCRRAVEFVTLKKQIYIFKGMISFLHQSLEMIQGFTESNINCIEYMNFVGAFSHKVACLSCLFWAKEANEETANEMNIALFDMMQHEFIPFAPNVIESYFGILKSKNLHSVLFEETVISFVDFFFKYLATTTVNDDYLIFRDQMISLFTIFLAYDHENAEELSEKSMILTDFMSKTETTFAKARQHYNRFSNSWIGLEAAKLDRVYFHSIQKELCSIEKHAKWAHVMWSQLKLCIMEFRFLRTFLLWFSTWDDSDEEIRLRLSSMIVSLQGIWGKEGEEKGLLAARISAIPRGDIEDWYSGDITVWNPIFELEGKIQLSKLEIEAWLVNWFHLSLQYKPSMNNKILMFLDSILHNLNALVNCRVDNIIPFKNQIETFKPSLSNKILMFLDSVLHNRNALCRVDKILFLPFKKQIETLKEKLVFLQNLLKLTENCKDTKELGEFNMFVQVFANNAACLTFLYWVKEANEINANEISLMLSDVLHKIKPDTPQVARFYFGTFKAIYLRQSDSLLFGQTASIFVDFVFEDLVTFFKGEVQNLRDDVIFLLTFLVDPAYGNAEELICSQIDNPFWEDVCGLLPIDDSKGGVSDKKVLLRGFMIKIETVNAKIRKLYCGFLDSSLYNLPKITSPWYLDFLIQNLRNLKEVIVSDHKFVPFAKYMIVKIEEELVSLSPLFNYIFEHHKELEDTWFQVVELVHRAEYVINSCTGSWFAIDHPIWYYKAYMVDVFDRIKVVKTKLEKIKENNMYNVKCLPLSVGIIDTFSKQSWTSEIDEVMVGFEEEEELIINDLTRGHDSLDIVSIVGMGGLGKTALAKKVSVSVKDHFNVLAFYTVSQDHNTRMLLLGILKSILKAGDEISGMTKDDLAHKLWKCLKRRKYLIVLDDIWSISVWNEVRGSFPDDQNGSRVMLTTRFHDVANKCKIQCSPLHLRFLSKVESCELLQKKVFQNGISPPHLSNIGRLIAESCKGLPLAIVVIAGLLARTERSESLWSEIAENVVSYLFDEGCTKILELSYSHLSVHLKPCLLYLGSYPEDKLITVKQVIRLWIAEGFIEESETKSIEVVAKEYLCDLAGRSLILVGERSCRGEIKTFSVHDLIRDLCVRKCDEGNFFKLAHGVAQSYNHYRISAAVVPATISAGLSSIGNASTLLHFRPGHTDDSLFMKLRLTQVLYIEDLYVEDRSNERHLQQLTSLANLRYFQVDLNTFQYLPSSISNLRNLQSLIITYGGTIDLPESFWKMKSLRHVNIRSCTLKFSDHGDEQLDKVVSFSTPRLSSAKDVERLLQRLPGVRKLRIDMCLDSDEPLDLYRKLDSLMIYSTFVFKQINFPSTLKKLSLGGLQLPSTANISVIAELRCLQVLRLFGMSFTRPIFEMEDIVFESLVFIMLYDDEMVQWNASIESFPCLEQFFIECKNLEELPPCFAELSSLKRITLSYSPSVQTSAFRIQEEQMELGNQVTVDIPDVDPALLV